MTLRTYQVAVIEAAKSALDKHGSAILQMPTGSGKTKAATHIVAEHDGGVWFVCHRREIIRQVSAAFEAAGIRHGIVAPDHGRTDDAVQIASVQSLTRRLGQLPPPSLVVWDECHHVAAKSWSTIREALPDALQLGLTATPERLDGKGLSEWFGELVCGPSIRSLVADGWLTPMRYLTPSVPDLTAAKMQASDYSKRDSAAIMSSPVLIGDAVAEYQKHALGKRAIAFCASVDASKSLVARFAEAGVPAAHVDGTTPIEERDAAVAGLRAGSILVLSNVEVFTEGFDLPDIDAAILLRPTKSLALFLQMVGRSLRPSEGKERAVIFDHAGLWLDHGRPDAEWAWSLDGGAREARLAAVRGSGERLRRCPECKEVQVERLPVCECGYCFPSGREIGEFDGVLFELNGGVTDGFETIKQFSLRHNISDVTARNWSRRGMPIRGYLIPTLPADAWVSANIDPVYLQKKKNERALPLGLATQAGFARELKVGESAVARWVDLGLLPMRDGYVDVVPARVWASDNKEIVSESRVRSLRRLKRDGYLSLSDFAKRHGHSPSTGGSWRRSGLPYHEGKGVPVEDGDRWICGRRNKNPRASAKWGSGNGLERPTSAARAFGISPETLLRYIKLGAPVHSSGLIDIVSFKGWASTSCPAHGKRPFWEDRPDEFCSMTDFANIMHTSKDNITTWRRRGLPCAANGWVHIQRGLEWVRDNTRIQIPPEAWPASSDNKAFDKAA